MTAKKKSNNTQEKSGRSHWLKLFLELIAVFVGITAGFFVNNYVGKRADRELEQKYLSSLHTNLVSDSLEIHSLMEEDQNNLDISERSVIAMYSDSLTLDSALAVILVMGTYNNLHLKDATYKSIVSSGKLGQIMDFEIREEIVNYYSFLDDIQLAEEVYNNYVSDYVLPFIFKNLDLISIKLIGEFDPGDIEFRNLTTGYYAIISQKMNLIMSMDTLNLSLINAIYKSLN